MGTTEPAQPGWPSQPTWPALPAYQPAASPPWQPPLPQQGWNGPSIVGFILSVYPVVPLVGSVVAVVLGFVGNAQAKRQHERGSGLAKWAIGLGTFGVVATVAVVVALLISAAGVVQAIVNNSDARQDLDNSVVAAKTYYAVEGTYAGLTPQRMDTLDRSLTYTAGGVGPRSHGTAGPTALSMVVAGDGKLVAFAAYAGGLGSRCDYIVDVADLRSAIIGTGASGGQISSAGDWEASRPTFPRGGCRAMASGGDLVWDQTDVTWSNPFSS